MTPRRYDMGKRAAAVASTRQKIVEATLELHTNQGILATSWEDIAKRADVAVGTVYRHFPSLGELLPACGELTMARLGLPSEEHIAQLFEGLSTRRELLTRMVTELFVLYERAAAEILAIRRNRHDLPPVQEAHEWIESVIEGVVQHALVPLEADERVMRVVRALADVSVWEALKVRGITGEEAVDAMTEILDHWIAGSEPK